MKELREGNLFRAPLHILNTDVSVDFVEYGLSPRYPRPRRGSLATCLLCTPSRPRPPAPSVAGSALGCC